MLTLPNNLNYLDIKKNSYPSTSQRRIYNSTNQATFTGSKSTIIRINLNAGWGEYLDASQSYLQFTVTNGSGVANIVDGSINCIFSRMEIYHNGRQIEDINNYNVLSGILNDMYLDESKRDNVRGILSGSEGDGITLSDGESKTFLVSLNLGLFNSDKYFYLGGLNGDLELRLTLEDANVAFVGGVSYSVNDVKYIGQVITLDSSAQQIVDAQTMQNDGVISMASVSYINHQSIKNQNDTSINALVPFRNASLKSIYVSHRNQADITDAAKRSVGKRVSAGLSQYQFDVNGRTSLVVNFSATNPGEALMELQRSMHNSSALMPSLIYDDYWTDDDNANSKFLLGYELESFQNSDTAISGEDTSNATIYYRALHGNYAASVIDFFGMYDVVYSIVDGELVAKM